MKIALDGFNLALERGTGVATYGRNLSFCLRDLGHEVHALYGKVDAGGKSALMQEIAFFDENAGAPEGAFGRFRRGVGASLSLRARAAREIVFSGAVIYDQFLSRLPHFDRLWNSPRLFEHAHYRFRLYGGRTRVRIPAKLDIMHWTYPLPVKLSGAKNIYTFHDLVPLRLPYTTLDRKRDYFKLVKQLADSADHIITVSETSKADIISLLGVDESKVTNTYQAVSIPDSYLKIPLDMLKDELYGAFELELKNYLLYYGSIEPKKNIARIIEAYLASNLEMPLVIVGAQAWKADQELRLLKTLAARKDDGSKNSPRLKIIQLDYVTFPQLINLIRGALAVTFPSLYEGFGLPILEGMMCGTPVITSNMGSMREIAGEAALLVDPYDTRDIKDAMIAIANDASLRQTLVDRGIFVSRYFSLENYQDRIEHAYRRVAQA
jgi:glycosyltransferase involved in cell wall biosynthesis